MACGSSDGDGEVGFAGADGSVEHGVLVPVDEMFAALRSFATADDHAKKLAENGNPLKPAQIREIGETASGGDFAEDEEFRLYLDDGTFVGIYQYRPSQNLTRPVKLFLERT